MKFFFLLENYNWFYTLRYSSDKGLTTLPYEKQIESLLSKQYYQADSLGYQLKKNNKDCIYSVPHCLPLQSAWSEKYLGEDGSKSNWSKINWSLKARLLKNKYPYQNWMEDILLKQVRKEKPDVLFVYSGVWLTHKFLEEARSLKIKIVLNWSCPIADEWKDYPFKSFDLILTSSQNLLAYFKAAAIPSFLFQQAFDARLLNSGKNPEKKINKAVFIGSFHPVHHKTRIEVISKLLELGLADVFCADPGREDKFKMINKFRKPEVSGKEMINTFSKYKIALHIPGDDFADDPGAKRLFEITGAGTFLLMSGQAGIENWFIPGKEIITFSSVDDSIEKIKYFLDQKNESERAAIEKAGHEKTMNMHTFDQRAKTLSEIINK